MQKSIQIENSVSGQGQTSMKSAQRYIAQGRAAWARPNQSIRFVESDYRCCAARESAAASRADYDRAAWSGMASLRELGNLPMVMPGRLLGFGRRKGASRSIFDLNRGL
jgi:hypothetical protein